MTLTELLVVASGIPVFRVGIQKIDRSARARSRRLGYVHRVRRDCARSVDATAAKPAITPARNREAGVNRE